MELDMVFVESFRRSRELRSDSGVVVGLDVGQSRWESEDEPQDYRSESEDDRSNRGGQRPRDSAATARLYLNFLKLIKYSINWTDFYVRLPV